MHIGYALSKSPHRFLTNDVGDIRFFEYLDHRNIEAASYYRSKYTELHSLVKK
jgi:hypothetical protein